MRVLYKLKKFIKKNIMLKFKNFFRQYLDREELFENINKDFSNTTQKKVLISYLVAPMFYSDTNILSHTNIQESIQILNVFISKGYCVDLVNFNNTLELTKVSKKKYDVIFGFGEPFYLAARNNPNSKKIIYLTELEPGFSYKKEKERIDYFYNRHAKNVPIERSGFILKKKYIDIADYGVLIGNNYTKAAYNCMLKKLLLINPTGFINNNYKYVRRNLVKSKKNFLWFGSFGAIHKGLDLLIDVFNEMPDCNLYICGLNKVDEKFLHLNKRKNIIDCGFIDVNSDQYLELVNMCSFVVLLSCAEGMATSVLTCMNHSMIPIVTKETGIDTHDFGILVEDYHVENVKQIIKQATAIENSLLEEMHKKTYNYSIKKFNLKKFTENFKNNIDVLEKED